MALSATYSQVGRPVHLLLPTFVVRRYNVHCWHHAHPLYTSSLIGCSRADPKKQSQLVVRAALLHAWSAGVQLPPPDHDQLVGAIKRQCAIHNLQPTDAFLLKVTQLYEMVVVRHGLMLVGQPFSGKSAALKVLAGALGDLSDAGVTGPLFSRVQQAVINPKAVTMGQLYGELSTQVLAAAVAASLVFEV
jgi:hypothetical protein